ncbi:DUF4830 domain-containing protein [Rossellomorea vietnamensis]|uniref:DUF4830 domain-containing protein n=1 Tax=Rossellomorea vietnamensis TaxID=218284 RepID=UPI001653833C|nr:DUF4830 domain-containing protein [Rossellomorea vietnamensis]
MKYIFASALLVVILPLLIWQSLNSSGVDKQLSDGECNKISKTISDSHKEYLLQYGWHIKSTCCTSIAEINYYPERMSMLQSAGINLETYNKRGKEAVITTNTLVGKQPNGDSLSATIYEIDGELVGGYGVFENKVPGIFSVDERERLIEHGEMQSDT